MNKPIDDFHEYVIHDVLGHIKGITSRKMFGGYGLYLDGDIFGIITDVNELRFKVDDSNRKQYEDIDSSPFIYHGHKSRKPTVMNYYLIPESLMEDRDKIYEWIFQSAELSRKK
jgi:DNA transformation protein